MSHDSSVGRSPNAASEESPTLHSNYSMVIAATTAIRDELSAAQQHVMQASDLIDKFFTEVPKAIQAPQDSEIPSTTLSPTTCLFTHPQRPPTTPSPVRHPQEVHEVQETPSPEDPGPKMPTSPNAATSPADTSDAEWTEERLTILASEKLNEVSRPSWKVVATKVGLPEEKCRSKWQEIKPTGSVDELKHAKSRTTGSAPPPKRHRQDWWVVCIPWYL